MVKHWLHCEFIDGSSHSQTRVFEKAKANEKKEQMMKDCCQGKDCVLLATSALFSGCDKGCI